MSKINYILVGLFLVAGCLFEVQAQTEEIFVSPVGEETQTNDIEDMEEKIFEITEVQPEFPGGKEARIKFLNDNLKFPDAPEMDESGKVTLHFVVEKDGSITNIEVVRSVNKFFDDEAIRVIKLMPKWTPAIHIGKPVRASFYMSVRFVLD